MSATNLKFNSCMNIISDSRDRVILPALFVCVVVPLPSVAESAGGH